MKQRECNYLIELIKNVLHNKKTIYNKNIDYNEVYKIAKKHKVESFVYESCKDFNLGELNKILEEDNTKNVCKVAVQETEKDLISNLLEENKIKYIALKGSILRNMYPKIELREMVDLDFLYEKEKQEEVKDLLLNLGYSIKIYNNGKDDVYFKKPFMNVEMHRYLVEEQFEMDKYCQDIWDKLQLVDNKKYEYKFSDEDFYIFMIVHIVKHFITSGIGIRSFIDVYVYLNKKTNLDFNYINDELTKLGINKFNNKVIELINIWFEGKESNEVMDCFAKNIFLNGSYGTKKNELTISLAKQEKKDIKSKKKKYIFRKLFPTFKDMKKRNPILNKMPFLLPWFYMTRLFKGLFKFKKHRKEIKDIDYITKEEINEINYLYKELGLDKDI